MTENSNVTIAAILCSYDLNRHQFLIEAIDSLINQSYPLDEIIVVISSSNQLRDLIAQEYSNKIKIVFSEKPLSATQARNSGIRAAASEILAFTDDDIVADSDWIKNLMITYGKSDAMAVGGKILPTWLSREPDYLPEELYWLVGAVHESYLPDRVIEIRNVYGPNMSFRKTVFQEVGLFDESLGFANKGTSYVQGEEPEFGLRMLDKLGRGIFYNPDALIYHKVPAGKIKLNVLFKRSFYQGYTKSLMNRYSSSRNILNPEKKYLGSLIGYYVPQRIKGIFIGKDRLSQFKKLMVLLSSILCVGAGFIYGKVINAEKK